ncbi:MAG: DUF928 domain-containing protein [Scytonema sp. PMC 1069.18]|nr:DUF928 domain-containing protein [Scytonema sp. PMC 1069.18]MEC4879746.1 DUF928 domain-containing protein [Scytonema sp. PMC 1070.18]
MKLAGVIPVILLCLASHSSQVHAQVTQPDKNFNINTQNRLGKLNFPRTGSPVGRRQGGARRNGCPDVKQPVTALVPGEKTLNNESVSFLALTVSEYPTFWVYTPELSTNLRNGEFVFQDERGKNIYKTPLTLPEKSGVIGISLPQQPEYALRTNNKYQWYFKIYCGNPENTSNYYYVKAWVQKVALTPNLESQLKAAKPKEYTAYTANQIWQDALTNLAELRRNNSNSPGLGRDWNDLLKAVGLEEFATAPIVGRYGSER